MSGAEEKQEALLAAESVDALLKYETANCERLRKLYATKAISLDELQRSEDKADHLREAAGRTQRALRVPAPRAPAGRDRLGPRGRRRRGIASPPGQCQLRLPAGRGPMSATVLRVCRHAGDSVSLDPPTPIVRLVDASRLRIRLEVDEAYVPRLKTPRAGTFQVGGIAENVGRLVVTTLIPQFGPKRLFTRHAPGSTPASSTCSATSSSAAFPEPRSADHRPDFTEGR